MKYLKAAIFLVCATGCEKSEPAWKVYEREEWSGPCKDTSVLLATTSGSPSFQTCPNRLHRMHVQVATHSSNEEAAALVFCQCIRAGDGDAGSKPAGQP